MDDPYPPWHIQIAFADVANRHGMTLCSIREAVNDYSREYARLGWCQARRMWVAVVSLCHDTLWVDLPHKA